MKNRLLLGLLTGLVAVGQAACSRDSEREPSEDVSSHPRASEPLRSVVASVNEDLGVPAFLWLGGGRNADDAAKSPTEVARATVGSLSAHYRLSAKNVEETLALRGLHRIGEGGVIVRFAQRVRDVEVFRAGINVALAADRAPIAATGSLSPHVTPKWGGRFAHDARASAARAFTKSLGSEVALADVRESAGAEGEYAHFNVASAPTLAARAKRVWFPTSTALVAAHYVEVERAAAGSVDSDLTGYVVSADSGDVLFENSMVAADSFAYRAWADATTKMPLPSPYGRATLPYPRTATTGFSPTFVAPNLVSIQNFPFSKNDPWLPAGAGVTTGNNVDAYADLAEPDGFGTGDVRATTTAAGAFDRTFSPTGAPAADVDAQQAIITHLFYVVNYMHDVFYDAGFDESAGNAQTSNFGRGGKEGDPIRAEAQDFSGRNNANMSTPADGASPRMQMYIFTGTPARDGALDTTVVAHEWGHYLANRLVSDGSGLSTSQARGMGEGWADFTSLLALSRADDAAVATNAGWRGSFAIGGYVQGGPYFGMRRYPYSIDMSKNPLTFKHIQNGNRLPTTVLPAFGASGANNAETHNTGEVWATMLWECFAALLRDSRYTHEVATQRMRRYLVASLQLTPAAPTLLDARDALLAAAYANNQQDFELFAAAFAKRGAGLRAKAPERYAAGHVGTVESFTSGNDLEIVSVSIDDGVRSCDADGFLDSGEQGRATVVIRNTGIGTLSSVTGRISASTSAMTFAGAGAIGFPTLKPFETAAVSVNVSLGSAAALLPFTITVATTDPTLAVSRDVTMTYEGLGNRDDRMDSSQSDNVEAKTTPWIPGGDSALSTTAPWTIKADGRSPANHVFYMRSNEAISDQYLMSPPLRVGTGAFKLTFRHRYFFEAHSDGRNFDGGVVEITTDDGATWTDVGAALYGGVIDAGTADEPGTNPLKTRRAIVGMSAGFPAFAPATIDFGTAYAGKNVRIRFRVGTDEGTGTHGWELDDLAFAGITGTPFPSQVANACTP